MHIPTAEEMRNHLKIQLNNMNNALSLAQINLVVLKDLVPNIEVRGLAIDNCITGILQTYFNELRKRLTTAYAQGTPATIDLDESLYALDCALEKQLDNTVHEETHTRASIIDEFISLIPFSKIHNLLHEQASSLVDNGKSIFADQIVDYLNLQYRAKTTRVKSGRVVLEMYTADYWQRYNFMRDIVNFEKGLRAVAMETGADFGFSVVELKNAVDALTYEQQEIPSRTTFGKSTGLEIVCFRTKYEFRFSRSEFDALTAFATLHGSDRSLELVNTFIDTVFCSQAA